MNATKTPRHTIRWFVYAGGYGQPLERLPRTASMRGSWVGYDAECSCGKGSQTGGAIKARITEWVEDHKREIRADAELIAAGIDPTDYRAVIAYYTAKLAQS
jgi:hypothetical protein